eukprot:m.332605 g.332605  ORF g.332605 m.332605 type:complete len:210 (-) comp16966_c0_seq1:112-741(-)
MDCLLSVFLSRAQAKSKATWTPRNEVSGRVCEPSPSYMCKHSAAVLQDRRCTEEHSRGKRTMSRTSSLYSEHDDITLPESFHSQDTEAIIFSLVSGRLGHKEEGNERLSTTESEQVFMRPSYDVNSLLEYDDLNARFADDEEFDDENKLGTCKKIHDLTPLTRRRFSSIVMVADRWQLSLDEAEELCHHFEDQQSSSSLSGPSAASSAA